MKKIEILKLLSLPVGLLILSFLGLLAVKNQYAQENLAKSNRVPTSQEVNTAPDESKIEASRAMKIKGASKDFKKPHGALDIQISSENESPMQKDGQAELVANLKVDREVGAIEVFWHLPEGVEITSGDQRQTISDLHVGDQQTIRIKVISHTDINRQIHLEASYLQGSLKIGKTAQYNTIDQPEINRTALNRKQIMSSRSNDSEETRIWQ